MADINESMPTHDTFASPQGTDAIAITYPTTTTEIYVYKSGGLAGTTLRTLTLTYSSPSKQELVSVEYS